MALASAPERLNPIPPDLVAEGRDQIDVAGHGVVVEVSPQHARQPAPLLGDGPVTAPPKLGFHLLQLRPHPLFDGYAPDPKPPVPRLPPNLGSDQFPSSMTPAAIHVRMSRRTRLAAMGCSRNLSIQE